MAITGFARKYQRNTPPQKNAMQIVKPNKPDGLLS